MRYHRFPVLDKFCQFPSHGSNGQTLQINKIKTQKWKLLFDCNLGGAAVVVGATVVVVVGASFPKSQLTLPTA